MSRGKKRYIRKDRRKARQSKWRREGKKNTKVGHHQG